MNNPIRYIGPDGGTVVIWYKNSNGQNHNGKTVITKGVTLNVIDKQKTQEYEKRKKATWTSEPRK